MKAVNIIHACMGGVSSRADRSVRFSVETCELDASEAASLLALHGVSCRILIEPDDPDGDMVEVKTERNVKTPSQRIRAVLYKVWQTNAELQDQTFDAYYKISTERIIEHLKSKIKE